MNPIRTAFANELYNILCKSEIPVFTKLREGGICAITKAEAEKIKTAFESTIREFYHSSDLEKLFPTAYGYDFKKVESIFEEARKRARENAVKAKEEFCKYFG